MRRAALLLLALPFAGCFGKIAPQPSDAGPDGSEADAGDAADGKPPFPAPNCRGDTGCLQDGLFYVGGVHVTCDPVYIPGPWTLVLERDVNNVFRVIETQVVDKPGFGATFDDKTAPAVAALTYRVCTSDDSGLRCGDPFVTHAPATCGCKPFTCGNLQACNGQFSNGCGNLMVCTSCPAGESCHTTSRGEKTCCPPGQESDGLGGCECAPPHPCPGTEYWEAAHCRCAPLNTPLPL